MPKWSPIEPIPENVGFDFQTFEALRAEYEALPEPSPSREAAITRVKRQWAIENGVIEAVYSLDPASTLMLEEDGLDTPVDPAATDIDPQLLAAILADHGTAFDVAVRKGSEGERITRTAIRQLHQVIVAHQPTYRAMNQFGQWFDATLRAGTFKTMPNNPTRPDGEIHQYCPPEQVDYEIDRLIDWYVRYSEDGIHPILISAWLHHRFSQIHPFQDGNGEYREPSRPGNSPNRACPPSW